MAERCNPSDQRRQVIEPNAPRRPGHNRESDMVTENNFRRPSGRRQEGSMSLDWTAENFEFNAALVIHRQNAGDRWIGILTADRDPPARRVRNRVVETAVEPSDSQLRNVRKHRS